jgi:two-component system, LytTR family, sensor kinase
MVSSDNSSRVYLIIYTAVWLVIGLSHGLILHYVYHLDSFNAMADSLVFNGNFAILGISVWYIARFNDLTKSSVGVFFLNHVFSMVFLVAIWLGISYLLISNLIEEGTYINFLETSITWRIITGLLYYALLALVFYVYIYYENFQQKIEAEGELRGLVKEAELQSLKNQINPHFLFNSLNSISSLTITNPEKAREMLVKLSELMRYSLKTNHHDKSKLEVELGNIEKYIALEKIRFGDKLNFEKDITEECCRMELPNMILQPLFENAIKHGIYESTESVTIMVHCKAINDVLQIKIENNFDPNAKPVRGEGIGLANIKKRLSIIYKNPDLLTTEIKSNIFTAKLLIPQN